jgi:ribose transport system permease protein
MSHNPNVAPAHPGLVGRARRQFVGAIRRQPAVAGAFVLAILLFLVATIRSLGFASLSNIQSLSIFASFIGLAAMGETLVIITGGIDLSIPWIVDLGGIGLSQMQGIYHLDLLISVILTVLLGAVMGAVNGFFVTLLRAPPLIVTLGVGGLIEGYLLAVGTLQSSGDSVSQGIQDFANAKIGPVPDITLVWIVLAIVAAAALSRTGMGRRIFATGDNPRAARLAGINVDRVRFFAYVVSGGTASLAGIFLSGFIQTAYVGMGTEYLFGAIAAIALGGTALLGGTGSSWGTVAGACTLTVLGGLLPMLGLSTAAVQIVYGAIILAGVYFARALHRLGNRRTGTGGRAPAALETEPLLTARTAGASLTGNGKQERNTI